MLVPFEEREKFLCSTCGTPLIRNHVDIILVNGKPTIYNDMACLCSGCADFDAISKKLPPDRSEEETAYLEKYAAMCREHQGEPEFPRL